MVINDNSSSKKIYRQRFFTNICSAVVGYTQTPIHQIDFNVSRITKTMWGCSTHTRDSILDASKAIICWRNNHYQKKFFGGFFLLPPRSLLLLLHSSPMHDVMDYYYMCGFCFGRWNVITNVQQLLEATIRCLPLIYFFHFNVEKKNKHAQNILWEMAVRLQTIQFWHNGHSSLCISQPTKNILK